MAEPIPRSPLHAREAIAAEDGAARMREVAFLDIFVLRCAPAKAAEPVQAATGAALPTTACTATRAGEAAVLWIGPDEWRIVTAPGAGRRLADDLAGRLAGLHHQIVEVSDYYTAIEIVGPRARDMLTKLTTLDVHPRAFPEGAVAGTLFAAAQGVLWRIGGADDPAYRLFVRRTMADYLWCLLAEAGREYGLPRQRPVSGETWRLAR